MEVMNELNLSFLSLSLYGSLTDLSNAVLSRRVSGPEKNVGPKLPNITAEAGRLNR